MDGDRASDGASGFDLAAALVREGDYWSVTFDGRELRIRDSKGVRYLAELLSRPGVDIPALQLVGATADQPLSAAAAAQASLTPDGGSDAGPTLDAEAKTAYRQRLDELEEEIERARAFHDPERAEHARMEYEAIAHELAAAVGLGGRDRRAGSPAERARLNATRAIKSAIERISEHDAALADYLTATVFTGRVCVYRPDARKPVRWEVRTRAPKATRRFRAPETRYARSGDLSIAYQVIGDGPVDLLLVQGWLQHVDFQWGDATWTSLLRGFAGFSRVITYDMRGLGLSDPVAGPPTLEERMDDARAVLDAVGSEQALVFGVSAGGPIAALFAATYPPRTAGLVLYGTFAAGPAAEGQPFRAQWGDAFSRLRGWVDSGWGEGHSLRAFAPSLRENKLLYRTWGMFERASMSPAMARGLLDWVEHVDVREALGLISTPTLVLHRTDDFVPLDGAHDLANRIVSARLCELPGSDHVPIAGDTDAIVRAVRAFATSLPDDDQPEIALATVVTVAAAETDALVEPRALHTQAVQAGGVVIGETARRLTARFEGPVRAIRFAASACDGSATLRAGVHTGNCSLHNDTANGIAVDIATSAVAQARPGEVLVTSTVRDLVHGSGIEFAARGAHQDPDSDREWPVFAVARIANERTIPHSIGAHTPFIDRALGGVIRHAPRTTRAINNAIKRTG
jgi:pimeloyl-ACP methyl ester carboxylesterase